VDPFYRLLNAECALEVSELGVGIFGQCNIVDRRLVRHVKEFNQSRNIWRKEERLPTTRTKEKDSDRIEHPLYNRYTRITGSKIR
jgi:hypothetical protein